jgi:DNA-binding Lrp family transcriptional regulator
MQSIDLDAIDLQLLAALQTDASEPHHQRAARCRIAPATALRRVRRLEQLGLIERTVALLQPERLAAALGHGLTAIVEVTLDTQAEEQLLAFEQRAAANPAVQQLYRVSPGPDFVLIVAVRDMPGYQALAQTLFTQYQQVRHVKAYFSLKRSKFLPAQPLPSPESRQVGA